MDKRTKVVICAATAYMLLSMMAMIIKSSKRKRRARRIGITYAPMDERDRMRLEYLNNKIWRDDTTCVNMLRLNRASFSSFPFFLGIMVCFKIPYTCVLSSKWPCF